jgi:indole-3-glycerol phosphate synthase
MSSDILQTIIAAKSHEVSNARKQVSEATLRHQLAEKSESRDFVAALRAKHTLGLPAVIAEVKRASPSQGVIREHFDPEAISRSYEAGGAACLSVLTDQKFFCGDLEHLSQAKQACSLPVLRKDFIVDSYQLLEAKLAGADCVLLIVAALKVSTLQRLESEAMALGLAVLVEVHDESELEIALGMRTKLIGVNNRDLRTFKTDVSTTIRLKSRFTEDRILVSESGISTPAQVARLRDAGVNTFLVGEAFMRAADPGAELATLFGANR